MGNINERIRGRTQNTQTVVNNRKIGQDIYPTGKSNRRSGLGRNTVSTGRRNAGLILKGSLVPTFPLIIFQ